MEHGIELEALLRDAGWLRRLAARLVGDGAADDLAQETWLAALRRPPRSLEEPRPWLARVARNLAANARRGSARREAREERAHVERPEPTPDELAQAAEAQRLVAEAVTRLDPPLRSAVVLCYYQGLDSRSASAQLGVPSSTLRTRLQRALEELRTELDRKRGRESWMMLLAPLARGGEVAAVAAGVSGALMLAGLAAGVALVGALVYVAWPESNVDARQERVALSKSEANLERADPSELPEGREALPAVESALGSAGGEPSPTARLAGTLLVDGRPPAWPIGLRLATFLGSLPDARGVLIPLVSEQYVEIPPEARGAFAFDDLPLDWQGRLEVHEFNNLDGSFVQTFDAPEEGLVLHLTAGPQIVGRLIDAEGRPAGNVEIAYQRSIPGDGTLMNSTTTLSDGRFRIWLPLRGSRNVARIEIGSGATLDGAQAERSQLALVADARTRGWLRHEAQFDCAAGLDLGELVLEPVRARALTVRSTDGSPLADACARIEVERPEIGCSSTTDATGQGELFLPERACGVRVSAFGYADRLVTVAPTDALEFELTPLALLTLTVPDPRSALVRLRSAQALFVWDRGNWDGPAQLFQENSGATHWNTLRPGDTDRVWEYEYQLDEPVSLTLVGVVPDQNFELELFDAEGRSLAVHTTRLAAGERAALTLGSALARDER